jgi:putative FmdB family regulatory protein
MSKVKCRIRHLDFVIPSSFEFRHSSLSPMPLYEFACRDCNAEFELLIRGSEQPQCPTCEGQRLEKLLSVPAAHTGSQRELPVCQPLPRGGCGLPQCGQGTCGLD